jgi:hypothetical protein
MHCKPIRFVPHRSRESMMYQTVGTSFLRTKCLDHDELARRMSRTGGLGRVFGGVDPGRDYLCMRCGLNLGLDVHELQLASSLNLLRCNSQNHSVLLKLCS